MTMAGAQDRRTCHTAASQTVGLPWWALALPVLAFVLLLTLMTTGGHSQSEKSVALAVSELVERVQRSLVS